MKVEAPPRAAEHAAPPEDVRARPLVVSRRPLRALLRRSASVGALVVVDVTGLVFAVYGALALRELYYGRTPLWALLWDQVQDWLPFLVLVTVLVFGRAGL